MRARPPLVRTLVTALLGASMGLLATPRAAEAFCGFYVASADASLYNNATLVVLMRDGTRTVLSMQNNYQGPPEDFALVVPVPVVLRERDVRLVPNEVFEQVDRLAAPRLVEYWEQDPCYSAPKSGDKKDDKKEEAGEDEHGVRIESKFSVGEYDIVVLSARHSSGLDAWLREHEYAIPTGAEPLLRPYVQQGMKFFVAKVDVDKVKFVEATAGERRATLSPLRFHYDSPEFSLPIRLGLINAPAGGAQDLLIHILATRRYEVANHPNVVIPTNYAVREETKQHFAEFYTALFDAVLAMHPGAVVTEYAWSAGACDPCPVAPLDIEELRLLGGDAIPLGAEVFDHKGRVKKDADEYGFTRRFVLTRLHARYDASSLGEDLVFVEAPPLMGGTGMPWYGTLDSTVTVGEERTDFNAFQARYAVLHHFEGKLTCMDPEWGSWRQSFEATDSLEFARQLAFSARDAAVTDYLAGAAPPRPDPPGPLLAAGRWLGCDCALGDPGAGSSYLAGLVGLAALTLLRRRRSAHVENRQS